jgi:hypothetical protein
MSENVGQISFHFEEGDETLPKPYSKYMENLIDVVSRSIADCVVRYGCIDGHACTCMTTCIIYSCETGQGGRWLL